MQKKFPDMTDEQLDKIFRDAARQYNPPSAPEGAWEEFIQNKERAEQGGRLETDNGKETNRKKAVFYRQRRPWLIVAAAMVLFCLGGIGIWYAMKKGRSTDDSVLIAKGKIIDKDSIKQVTPTKPKKAGTELALSGKNEVVKGPKLIAPLGNSPEAGTLAMSKAMIMIQRKVFQSVPQQMTSNKASIKVIDPFWVHEDGSRAPSVNAMKRNKDSVGKRLSKADFLAANDPFAAEKTVQLGDKLSVPDGNYGESLDKAASSRQGRWQLGLIVGPNLTTVNGTVGKTAGFNTGVVVQRRINDSKFTVGSGVVLESMVYKMAPGYFHPGGKTLNIPSLTSVEGKCQMLDVPVNVRYDVMRNKKSKAFVSTGVSGLLMAKETYSYNYDNNGQVYQRSVTVTGKGKSLYTVTNLSIGYERSFKRTSVQIEPYIKLPMSSIGYGELNLGSLGAQISIKRSF
jgi:hypothetical protein